MPEAQLHALLVLVELGLAAATLVALFVVSAPYGRHLRAGWGPTLPSRVGWILMESPAWLLFVAIYALGRHRSDLVPSILLLCWLLHYLHRGLIFPFRIRSAGKRMPLVIVGLALVFNVLNSWINARWLSELGGDLAHRLGSPSFVAGLLLFAAGLAVNLHADTVLIRLRRPGERGYRIPTGGLYRWVTCPNYLGEILEWCGFALAAGSTAAWAFALYTVANLLPRALEHHRWYRETFADYPPERRALIPLIL